MNMEIEESQVTVHPLALVHMSDHYTRVRMGGSTAPTDAPVVGLLFGDTASITDAEDTPLEDPGPAVSLHQAVFANNFVLGSYRVTKGDEEPTAADLQQTLTLRKSFDTAVYFGLVTLTDAKRDITTASSQKELPLQLFMVPPNKKVLVLADWKLETAAPERVAIEHVLRDKVCGPGEAWQALDIRLTELVQYLERTKSDPTTTASSSASSHFELWRQIQGLLVQAHLLRTSSTSSPSAALERIAVLAKAVDAVAWYTDKYRSVQETLTTSRGGSKGQSTGLSLLG